MRAHALLGQHAVAEGVLVLQLLVEEAHGGGGVVLLVVLEVLAVGEVEFGVDAHADGGVGMLRKDICDAVGLARGAGGGDIVEELRGLGLHGVPVLGLQLVYVVKVGLVEAVIVLGQARLLADLALTGGVLVGLGVLQVAPGLLGEFAVLGAGVEHIG